jgi:acyl-CoA reductase-like NAD-dependent aldehyde dehydrogenase
MGGKPQRGEQNTMPDGQQAITSGPFQHLINGRMEASEAQFPVINPATGEPFATCPDATREQLDRAVAAARQAFVAWRSVGFADRRDVLHRFADALEANVDLLAPLLTREQGKPLAEARGEIQRSAASIREICTIVVEPELLREDAKGRIELHYRPLGVVGGITPWNVPIVLAAPKIASAVFAGNTFILKPSPYTPLTTLKMGEIAADIFPPGVLNVLAGGNDFGQWMTEHPGIDKISFTGSVPTGKRVMASGTTNLKRVTLELGGNDAAIVLDDADVNAIAPRIFAAAFTLSGQVCQAIKRLYVHQSIYELMVQELTQIAETVRVGDGFEEGVQYGPIQNKMQYDEVLGILADTKAQPGVRITTGGHALNRPGYFIAPTIVADIKEGTRLVDEEPFGPVLPVLAFTDIAEVIGRANNSRFGLGGSVWTRDIAKGATIARQLEAGVVWVNHHVGLTRDLPFGGAKESGIGRQGHAIGVKSDMEPQVVVIPAG